MANPLMVALRARRDLKESVLHTAQEIAARCSRWGVTRTCALAWLAVKCHCSKQTIINHIKTLIRLRILRKRVIQIKGSAKCEINVYSFILPWKHGPAQTCNSQNFRRNLPPQKEREKYGSVREEIAGLQKGLRLLTLGSVPYEASRDKLVALTALLAQGYGEYGG